MHCGSPWGRTATRTGDANEQLITSSSSEEALGDEEPGFAVTFAQADAFDEPYGASGCQNQPDMNLMQLAV